MFWKKYFTSHEIIYILNQSLDILLWKKSISVALNYFCFIYKDIFTIQNDAMVCIFLTIYFQPFQNATTADMGSIVSVEENGGISLANLSSMWAMVQKSDYNSLNLVAFVKEHIGVVMSVSTDMGGVVGLKKNGMVYIPWNMCQFWYIP